MEAISGALCFEPWKCLHGGGSVPCVGHSVGMRTFISAVLWYYSKAAIGSTKTMVKLYQIQHVLLICTCVHTLPATKQKFSEASDRHLSILMSNEILQL